MEDNYSSAIGDNDTYNKECSNTYGCVIASCLVTLISTFAIVGNSLNIAVIVKGKFLTKPHEYFLISLAVADLLTGITNSFSIYPSMMRTWPYGDIFCFFTNYVRESLLEVSLQMILCLNLERYIAISYPLRSKIWVTRKRGKIVIFLCWFLTFTIKIYLLFDVVYIVEYDDDIYACSPEYDNYKGIAVLSSTMMEVPGLIILTITSAKLMVTLHRVNSKKGRQMLADQTSFRRRYSSKSRNLRKKVHGFKVLAVVATVSYISLLPALSLNLLYIYRDEEDTPTHIFWAVEFSFFWLASCGSFVNVFVYFLMDRNFSKCLRDMFKRSKSAPVVLSRGNSSKEDTSSPNVSLSVISDNSLNLNFQDNPLDVGL